jgi:hypothetical protein
MYPGEGKNSYTWGMVYAESKAFRKKLPDEPTSHEVDAWGDLRGVVIDRCRTVRTLPEARVFAGGQNGSVHGYPNSVETS